MVHLCRHCIHYNSGLQIEMTDFERALSEVKPAFGAVTETLEQYRLNGMVDSGEHFRHLQSTCRNLVEQVTVNLLASTEVLTSLQIVDMKISSSCHFCSSA